jgi:hypothetical protein
VTRRGNGIVRLGAALAAVAFGTLSPQAGAALTPDVVIDCPWLSKEQQASLEARARAELAMNYLTESEIHISCAPPLIVVTYAPKGTPVRSSSAVLVQDIDQWVEEILALIHAAIAPPSEPAPSTMPAEAPIEPYAPAYLAPIGQPQVKYSSAVPTQFSHEESRRGGVSRLTSVGGGLCSELWAKPVNVLMGFCASIGLSLPSFWRLAATGATQWSTAKPSDIGLHLWQGAVEARIGRDYWFAFGTQMSIIHLTPDNGLLPRSKFAYEPTLALRVGFSTSLAGQRLVTGVGLRSYAVYRDVRVDGKKAFQLPMLALTLGIEYEIDL